MKKNGLKKRAGGFTIYVHGAADLVSANQLFTANTVSSLASNRGYPGASDLTVCCHQKRESGNGPLSHWRTRRNAALITKPWRRGTAWQGGTDFSTEHH